MDSLCDFSYMRTLGFMLLVERDCSLQTFRPVARSHVAQPLVLELDMDSDDIGDDTTEPDSNENMYDYEQIMRQIKTLDA